MDFSPGSRYTMRMLIGRKTLWMSALSGIVILGLALCLRTAGLYRDLADGLPFHPDEPKQISALYNFLQGHYLWYVGNLFYDGYPLFLNHVDEWLLRPVLLARKKQAEWLGLMPPPDLSREELYYWARALRVLYGLFVVLAAWAAARPLGLSRRMSLLGMALLAVSPLSVAVAHSATGDVGVDLFVACVILCVGWRARHDSARWALALAGFFSGWAFASKYHGAMAAGIPLLFLLAESLSRRTGAWGLLRRGTGVLAAVAAGAVLAIPPFFMDAQTTWRNMWGNFIFIKNYNVKPEFLEKPLLERWGYCLANNTPRIVQALGVLVVLLALAGSCWAAWEVVKMARKRAPENRPTLLAASLGLFAVLAVIFSIAGKPEVQPFHFSYLQLPLVLVAAWFLARLAHARAWLCRMAALILGLGLLLEQGQASARENFFWSRQEVRSVCKNLLTELVDRNLVPVPCPQTVRVVSVEDGGRAVFRNAPARIPVLNGRIWNRLGVAPVPSVPLPGNSYWIFVNGPVFPRNDRMFHVPADTTVKKGFVFPVEPEGLRLAIQSGLFPVQVTLGAGGKQQAVRLPAYSSRVVELSNIQGRLLQSNAWFVECRATTSGGQAWIKVLATEQERDSHLFWSGSGRPLDSVSDEILPHLESAYYLSGDSLLGQILQPSRNLVLEGQAPLAAGIYRLSCEVSPLSEPQQLELTVSDPFFGEQAVEYLEDTQVNLGPPQTLSRVFQKAFSPTVVALQINSATGSCRIGRWELKPAVRPLVEAVNRLAREEEPLSWLQPRPVGARPVEPGSLAGVVFGRGLELLDVQVPAVLEAGPVPVWCSLRVHQFPLRNFGELFVFIHVVSVADGELCAVMDFPAWKAALCETFAYPISCRLPESLPAGDYELWMGMYNPRTNVRLDIHLPRSVQYPMEDQKILIGRATRKE